MWGIENNLDDDREEIAHRRADDEAYEQYTAEIAIEEWCLETYKIDNDPAWA